MLKKLISKFLLFWMPVAFLNTENDLVDLTTCQFATMDEEDEQESILGLGANISKLLTTNNGVPGRIVGRHEVYRRLGASEYIIDTVREGYRLVLESNPPPTLTPNNKSALNMPDFVIEELNRLESLGCLERVYKQPTVVMPLSAVFSKKWRLVLDASRDVNPYCEKISIKLDDLSTVAQVVRKGDYMISNDLDSGYWHIGIHPEDRHLLGVHFVDDQGDTKFWVWKVLALGLRDAAHIFTKIIKPIMGELRQKGFRCLIYIDDKLTINQGYLACLEQEQKEKELFEEAGW